MDDADFGELVKQQIDAVYSFLVRYTGSADLAEDATQEAFVKAWRNIHRFDASRPIKPWLFEIARNTANDMLRKKRSARFSELTHPDADTAFEDSLPDPDPLPPEIFEIKELGEAVQEALTELPERDRAILTLRYIEELTWDDVAASMGAPVNTVKSWHHRALIGLRKRLARFAPNPHDGA